MDKKRIILLVLFTFVTISLGALLYFVFFAPDTPQTISPDGQTPTTGGQLPTSNETTGLTPTTPTGQLPTGSETAPVAPGLVIQERVTKVVNDNVVGAQVSSKDTVQYYNNIDGRFYHILPDGSVARLSDDVFYQVENITWSPSRQATIIEYPDGSNIYYDFEQKKQVTLPKSWEEFSFAPTGDNIFAKNMSLSPENQWLVMSNPDGENVRLIAQLGDNADKVSVNVSPNNQVVAFSATGDPLGTDRQEILFIGQNKENFKSAIVEGRGFEGIWSPNGEQVLYSVYSTRTDYKPELWIVNGSGEKIGTNRKQLNINTWANTCTFFSEQIVYCAVPARMDTGAAFAPDRVKSQPDFLYKIDLKSGQKQVIDLNEVHYIDTITIDKTHGKLYFTDRTQIGMFSVDI